MGAKFSSIINEGWHQAISKILTKLHHWNRENGGSLAIHIQKVIDSLHHAQENNCKQTKAQLNEELKNLLKKVEEHWWQRSRVDWLHAGDRNTSFFHRKATVKRKRNLIKGLLNPIGIVATSGDEIDHILINHLWSI